MHSYQPNINFQLNKRTTPVHGSNIFMYVNACSDQIHPCPSKKVEQHCHCINMKFKLYSTFNFKKKKEKSIGMSFVFGDEFKIVSDFPQKHLRDLDPVLTARRREKGLQIRSSKLREKNN